MAVLLEDIVKSVEQLLKLISKRSQEQSFVDPTLDPVLLVPGIAGSILNAVDAKTGKTERVWVRIVGADHEFRDKLWSYFDPATGHIPQLPQISCFRVPQIFLIFVYVFVFWSVLRFCSSGFFGSFFVNLTWFSLSSHHWYWATDRYLLHFLSKLRISENAPTRCSWYQVMKSWEIGFPNYL